MGALINFTEYDKQGNMSPVSISLDGEWRFAVDPGCIGINSGWTAAGFDDSTWETVIVPHTWGVEPAYASYDGCACYRRTFRCPADVRVSHVRLRFQAVYYLARVWLNGIYLGLHEGGYTPFEFDVSSQVKSDVDNTLVVHVDNRRATDRLPAHLYEGRSFGWKNHGGIVRPVSLEVTGKIFITQQKVVAAPHLTGADEADSAAVATTITVRNTSDGLVQFDIVARVYEEDTGAWVSQVELGSPVHLPPGESVEVALATTISHPRLWHFDRPHLYRWSASLVGVDGADLHTAQVNFGVRSIELKEARFHLNGEAVRLVGLSRHADSPEHGLAETVAVMAGDYDDLKRLNMVFGRPVHYPQHEFILDYCDRHGILLIPELPAWQLTAGQMADACMRQLAQGQLHEMVEYCYNHPSVWAWSVGNELESDTVAGRAYVRDMIAYVKSLDPTRPVSFASYHLLVGRPWADATQYADFVMMNQYFGTWHGPKGALDMALETIHATWPEKPVIISEYGIAPDWQKVEGPQVVEPDQYYFMREDQPASIEGIDTLRLNLIVEQMDVFRTKPFVAGAIFWDYAGLMGVVDERRQRRGSWRVLRDEYSPICIDALKFSSLSGAEITLRARGPVEADMPVYTLRGYSLRWAATSSDKKVVFSQGELLLPTLPPASAWSGEITWPAHPGEAILTVSVDRPSGFAVLERSFDSQGNLLL
jgi:beta-glucuronidase